MRSTVVAPCQQRRPLWLTSLAFCGALVFSANGASAQAIIDGASFCNGAAQDFDEPGVSVRVQSGDVFTLTGGTVSVRIGFPDDLVVHLFSDSATWIVPNALNGQAVDLSPDGFGSVTCTRTVVAPAPSPAPAPPIPAAAPAPAPPVQSTVAMTSISVQASVTQNAISTNMAGRFGGSGFAASSSNGFVSSRGLDHLAATLGEPEFNGWVALDARRFTGTAVGDSGNVTVGFIG